MFRLNLKIAFRNLWKHKIYTFINISGLSIAMASCILIFLFIRYQMSFDDDFKNKDRIYRVVSNWKYVGGTDASQGVPIPLAPAMRNDFPQLEQVSAIQRTYGVLTAVDQGKPGFKTYTPAYYAEPAFFDIFDFTWLSGEPHQALSGPNKVAISKKTAIAYFGNWQQAIGKTLRFQQVTDCEVTAVFEDRPDNTSLPLDVVVSYATFDQKDNKNWGSVASSSECYVLLKPGTDVERLNASMGKFNKQHYSNQDETNQQYHSFQALKDIHHSARYGNFAGRSIELNEIYGLAVIGLFLMLTACINFINLATAQAVGRSKEVGIRKVMGSGRKQLMIQFLSETLAISIIAVLLGCVLTEMALPYLQELFDDQITFSLVEHPIILAFLFTIVLLVSFLAGFYPALIISGFSPALAIKNKISSSNSANLGLRKVLLVLQFTITAVLVISTIVLLKQMNFMRAQPLGYNPEATALISLPSDSLSQLKHQHLKAELLAIPGVQAVSLCADAPSSNNVAERGFAINGNMNKDFQVRTMHVDQDYFKTFELKIIAGKALGKSDTTKGFVVNETLLKKLNIKDPNDILGKLLKINDTEARILGVSKDFNDRSLHQGISPIAMSSDKSGYYSIAIKLDSKQMLNVMKVVEILWNKTFPNDIYQSSFVNDELDAYYAAERIMGVLFEVFSCVIIFISFVGLFGLISFVTVQRTREVAIRKVLGASTYQVVNMLNGSFLQLVFLSNLIAWPVAYMFIDKWLSQYAYRIDLSIWPFLAAMLISMFITLITASFRAYKVAGSNPIDALKYE